MVDFKYLDKEEYKDIVLLDENAMSGNYNEGFFIRKYKSETLRGRLHRHKYIQINYVSKGGGVHLINNQQIDIYKGDIFIIPPYIPHKILANANKNLEIIEFEFDTEFILPSYEQCENSSSYLDFAYLEPFMVVEEQVKPRFNLDEKLQAEVENILNEALFEYQQKNSGYNLVTKALLLKLLVITGRAYSAAIKGTETERILNKFKDVITKTKGYINLNYNREITLNEIAKESNYSKSHFSYLFKAVTGQTFVEYLNKVRIEKAIELLKNTDKSIIEISYAVGYNSVANFNKNFKSITGLTPKKFR